MNVLDMDYLSLTSLFILPCLVVSAPVSVDNLPSEGTINFMKQFGYIEAGPENDAIFTKEGFEGAVKMMQRFGGLPETGELDEETLKLTTAPRCGVPDVIKPSRNRTKRYIVGSEAWHKKSLTYFLANWPPELESEVTSSKLKLAFQMWSDITPLNFTSRSSMDADMIVAFGRGPHGDGYAFDGPSGILAHAFFPYEHDNYGGDIHFDDDENWIDGSVTSVDDVRQGVDFYTVATHEIGHSLGLAHSTVPGSIMFPYYKGYTQNMRMDYDDIVAMYDLYVLRGDFKDEVLKSPAAGYPEKDDESKENGDRKDSFPDEHPDVKDDLPSPNPGDEDVYKKDNGTNSPKKGNGSADSEKNSTGDVDVGVAQPTISPNNNGTEKSKKKTPSLCEGIIDAIGFLRGELFVFKGLYVWRMSDLGQTTTGYPVYFHNFFRGFPWSVKSIDAVYQRTTDYHIAFFTGKQFWIFNGNEFLPESPKPLTDLGLPSDLDHIDAALVWSKNKKTYLFSNDLYWRFDEISGKVESIYPQKINRWKGIPQNLSAAFTWKDDYTYFFKGAHFWRFNNQAISADADFPLPTAPYWFHCPQQS